MRKKCTRQRCQLLPWNIRLIAAVNIPAWYLLLVAVLEILSRCQSLWNLERFAICHHGVLTEALELELRRPPSYSAIRYFFRQVEVAALSAAIRDWTITQIPGGTSDFDQLVFDGKTLRGSVEPIAGGRSAFIAQVTLYSAALGLANCYAEARELQPGLLRHRREPRAGSAQKASRRAGSPGRSDPGGRRSLLRRSCPAYPEAVFQLLQEQGADFLLTVEPKASTKE